MPTDRPLVDQLRESLNARTDELAKMLEDRKASRAADAATLTDEERSAEEQAESEFRAAFAAKEKEIDVLSERITQEKTVESRKADAAKNVSPRIEHVVEPLTYRKDNAREVSYFADLYATFPGATQRPGHTTPQASSERLRRHGQEMSEVITKRNADAERRAMQAITDGDEKRGFKGIPARELRKMQGEIFERQAQAESRVNPSTVLGQGGELVPPLWLEQDLIPYMRAGRVASDLVRNVPLPAGTDSINLPKITTPTLVAPQTANNQAVVSQDVVTTSVNTGVKTLAGQEDVALQLLELAPSGLTDRAITEDLLAAYNLNLDFNVVQGVGPNTGTGGGLLGMYPTTNAWGATAVTNTQSSPTAAATFPTFGVIASQIAQKRYDNTNIQYLVHPRRGYWFVSALDGASSKPLVESAGFSPWNPAALEETDVAEGLIARFPWGPGLHISANVPTTDNGSGSLTGTYDPIFGFKADDIWLFEGDLRVRVLQEVLSGTLQIRFQAYNYVGMIVRYGASIAIASGTGCAAPTANSGSF